MTNASYHARIKEEKRARLMVAAKELFLEQGYDRTSLAQIAKRAEVSTATLFKRFPTKADLFKAIVEEQWQLDSQYAEPPEPGDPRCGLTKVGRDYACLLARPGTADLFRLVIASLPRFPDIAATHFSMDRGPFFDSVCEYLAAEVAAGTLRTDDVALAARQFLGIISGQILWPQLVRTDFTPPDPVGSSVVDQAVEMMLARYGRAGRAAGAQGRPRQDPALVRL